MFLLEARIGGKAQAPTSTVAGFTAKRREVLNRVEQAQRKLDGQIRAATRTFEALSKQGTTFAGLQARIYKAGKKAPEEDTKLLREHSGGEGTAELNLTPSGRGINVNNTVLGELTAASDPKGKGEFDKLKANTPNKEKKSTVENIDKTTTKALACAAKAVNGLYESKDLKALKSNETTIIKAGLKEVTKALKYAKHETDQEKVLTAASKLIAIAKTIGVDSEKRIQAQITAIEQSATKAEMKEFLDKAVGALLKVEPAKDGGMGGGQAEQNFALPQQTQ